MSQQQVLAVPNGSRPSQGRGVASQLSDSLELTSTPARSKTEIVALLGGSFVDTLGRGDSTLGLVNLAGSALLGTCKTLLAMPWD
jgi:translocation and assembly module TamB